MSETMQQDILRADQALVQRGLAASRERAQDLIAKGLVYINATPARKPAQKVASADQIEVRGESCPYVSRGGFKLEKALQAFNVSVQGKTCIDVGASTGGFTDVLLQNGAQKVYAVDVGVAQLDPKIEGDARVVQMEQINARTLTAQMFEPRPQIAVMDVSFISIEKILPALRAVLGENGRLISLIKPQFEAGRSALGKKGVIRKAEIHEQVLLTLCQNASQLGWRLRAIDYSPISGTQGNIEFLGDFIIDDGKTPSPDAREIRRLVRAAHAALRKSTEESNP